MKTTVVTVVSIGCNLALIAMLCRDARPVATRDDRVAANASARVNVRGGSGPVVFPASTLGTPRQLDWSQIESSDLGSFASNLRAVGCPPATVRDIIVGRADALFTRKVDDMVDAVEGRFWEILRNKDRFEALINEKADQLRELEKERDALLEAALAPGGPSSVLSDEVEEFTRTAARRQLLDFLPAEKLEQMLALDRKYDRLRAEIAAAGSALKQEERQAEVVRLERQQRFEVEQGFSAEELEEFNLRESPFAAVRFQLGSFSATEAEIREIARIRDTLQKRAAHNRNSVSSQEEREQLIDLLGPERFQAYQRAQDYQYQQLYRLAERLGLSPDMANAVYETRRLAEECAKELRARSGLEEASRNAALARIRVETENSFAETLGPDAFAIVRKGWQDWLKGLGQ